MTHTRPPALARAAALLLALPLAAACGEVGASTRFAGTVDTLNGVVHVRSPATGMWQPGEEWTLVEELRIGAEDGKGPEVFARVAALETDALGRIYVLEPQAKQIRVFGADGRHVRTMGREGGGPGEFKDVVGLEWDRQGRLWTLDQGNTRFSVFDTTGAFVTSHRKDGGLVTYQWTGGITRAGEIFAPGVRRVAGARQPELVMVRYDSAGVARDTFALPRYEGPAYRHETDRTSSMASVPFAPDLVTWFGPDGRIWGGISDRYRLAHTTLKGDTLRIVEREWTAPPVSAEEREKAIEGLKWMADQGAKLDFSRIPAAKPAFDRLFTDDADHLWVQSNLPGTEPGKTLDVFDPEGRFLGTVRLPARLGTFDPVLVRGDRLYTVVLDEMEIPYVVRYRIQGRTATAAAK